MKRKYVIKSEPSNVLHRIKRGLCGYVSYLAACEMNEAFSEYVLYEPILRILTARGYTVRCEYECPGIPQPATGARKRLDFYATNSAVAFALEVKWARTIAPRVAGDILKLQCVRAERPGALAFLCVFGRGSLLERLRLQKGLRERGTPVYAEFKTTRFGCRVFEVT